MKIRIQARILTFDPKKKAILLVRNAGRKFWCLPGGGLEDGEDIKECAVREMQEETGLQVDLKHLLYVQELHDDKDDMVIMELFWFAKLSHEQALDENHIDGDIEGGVEEVKWFTKDKLQGLTVYPERLQDTFWDNIEDSYDAEDPFIGVFK